MNKPFLYALCLCVLSACAGFRAQDLPELPPQQALWFQVDKLDTQGNTVQTSLLSVQGSEDGSSRWVMTDAFGAPQARLSANSRGWQADGFAPPNRAAKKLFTAMFPLLKQDFRRPQTIHSDPNHSWRITPIADPEGA
ncbi:hypothetical protein L4G92_03470 [Neisseria sp. ZJ106]|uniref:Lipoprotein n=1 Tax=Neisseria lisongii TaxID=2912188 RepID=A0AAW5ALD7_9NEIS|nr:hypothetical protein [Neisseria lisongii]MCF7521113.1 hypothetical protein [Neisseria lisongii]MCF7529236.1 hypothetical protein [Neisseria lisongii]WCL72038.1 hypothetical protein PJU73_02675 [Neisseria lisongii]